MKKSVIIISGILILTILVAVWIYLLFFGTPRTPNEVFANLGISGGVDSAPITFDTDLPAQEPVTKIAQPTSALQQLTTRPVAGMQVQYGAQGPKVWYMERGTGYIYQIDLTTRVETQLSQVTIPLVTKATFAPDGSSVLYSRTAPTTEHTIAVFATTSNQLVVTDFITLPPVAENIVYETDTTVLYTIPSDQNTIGYRYDITTEIREELFIVPLTQITMSWGEGRDSMVLYTKPDFRLPGYAYTIVNNELVPYGPSGKGLTVTGTDSYGVFTTLPEQATRPTTNFVLATGEVYDVLQVLIPEKCAVSQADTDQLWCASPSERVNQSFVNDWYKGTVSTNDYLFSLSIRRESGRLLADFQEDTGRVIDVTDLQVDQAKANLLFRNRIDNTLWRYDLLFDSNQ